MSVIFKSVGFSSVCDCFSFALWSDNAYACDPRIARFKFEEKERKQAEKRARQEAFRQKADEEEKVCILLVRMSLAKTKTHFM